MKDLIVGLLLTALFVCFAAAAFSISKARRPAMFVVAGASPLLLSLLWLGAAQNWENYREAEGVERCEATCESLIFAYVCRVAPARATPDRGLPARSERVLACTLFGCHSVFVGASLGQTALRAHAEPAGAR